MTTLETELTTIEEKCTQEQENRAPDQHWDLYAGALLKAGQQHFKKREEVHGEQLADETWE